MARKPRGIVKFPGSKNLLAKWIISKFPLWRDSQIELFGGSAAVTMATEPSHRLEVINDLNWEMINLFTMIRDRPEEMFHKIYFTLWTAESLKKALEPADDLIERAYRYYCRLWMAFYPFDDPPSFRRQKFVHRDSNGSPMGIAAHHWGRKPDQIFDASGRLRRVQFENMDALELIADYDHPRALFYADPPYTKGERVRKNHYGGFEYSEADHVALAEALLDIEGMAVLSGYANDLYSVLYEDRGWARVDRAGMVDGGGKKTESLWLNPAVQERLELEKSEQMAFAFME